MVTTEEFLEAAMPSAESALGAHPHAPSQPTDSPGVQQEGPAADRAPVGSAVTPVGAAGGLGGRAVVASAAVEELGNEQAGDGAAGAAMAAAAPVLAAVGKEYLGAVQEGEGVQYEALLGREHIFMCEVHA